MATVYGGDCIRVGAGGVPEIVFLTVEDDDRNLESGEAGVTFAIDGVVLGAAPATFFGSADVTLIDGSAFGAGCVTFTAGGDTYIFGLGVDASRVIAVGAVVNNSPVGGTAYTSRDLVVGQERVFIGDAVVVVKDRTTGAVQDVLSEQVTVYDDDVRIQFDGTGGAPDSEAGGTPVAFLGASSDNVDFNRTDGSSTLVLVEVEALDGGGNTVVFEAIKTTHLTFFNGGPVTKAFYIPRAGTVDPADIASVTSETLLAASLDGAAYRDFGLGSARTRTDGSSGDDVLEVGIGHDLLRGLGGADSLFGNLGEDRLDGGVGNDRLFGGMHNDRLDGGGGADLLDGGVGNDQASGGDARDTLFGGWGDDSLEGNAGVDTVNGGEGDDELSGGAEGDQLRGDGGNDSVQGDGGNDTVRGHAGDDELSGGSGSDVLQGDGGADTLDGGTGADEMTGGAGADVFVLVADGADDTIVDFRDGTDVIDIDAAFGALAITDVSAGVVRVEHNGDVLFVADGLGLLTAASLTSADFD
jgi:Ca2+-binding RTX toxin-like protein